MIHQPFKHKIKTIGNARVSDHSNPVNIRLFLFTLFFFSILLWSLEQCSEHVHHAICLLPISILFLVITIILLLRCFSHLVYTALIPYLVLVLVVVGLLTQATAEAAEPKKIIIGGGGSFEPMMFLNADGGPDGVYADMWRLRSEKTGVKVELRLMVWAKVIPALRAGEVDAVDGVTYTSERAKFLDFSASHSELNTYIYFHESIGGVKGLADLEGFPVGVIGGSHVEDFLRTEAPKVQPVPYVNYEEIVRRAIGGRLRVFMGEDPMIPFFFAKTGHRIEFRRNEVPIIRSDMRTAVRKGDTELLALIERGHAAITSDEWQRIRDKWAGVSLASRIPWRWLIGGVAVLLAGIALLLLWNTQLKRQVAAATRTLSESEERLRSFGNALPDVAFVLDEDGRYLEILTAEEHLLYKDISDLKNSVMHEVLPKDVADQSLEVIGQTISIGKTQIFEYKLDFSTGQRWFEARLSPMFGTSYDKRIVTCISRDITERKKVEEALRESEERLKLLFEFAPDAYYLIDLEGRFLDGNQIAEKISGYKKEELIGKNFFEVGFLAPDQIQKATTILEKNIQGLPGGPAELLLTRKDGSVVSIEISTYPVKIKNQIQILGIARDITERNRSEEEKRKLESQLVQAQKMEAIGTLAGGIAHDFNNILSAIIGYSELALDDANAGSLLERNLRGVLKAGGRAKDLVQQILTFSRQSEQELKPLQVGIIAKEVLKLIRATFPTTIEIRRNIQSNSAVLADSAQVHQIFMNLCTNAGHAMTANGGTLDISLKDVNIDTDFLAQHPEMTPGAYINLTVKDTGHGMAPDIVERIFEPYFTTKGKGEGTGLGLSVIHGIVRSYKGAVTVLSEPGKGSTFKIFLPIIESEASADAETKEPLPTGNERILFIDDEPTLVEIANEMLGKLGYGVDASTSSIEALELFKTQPDKFDLVITDMTMPGMTGDELARNIIQVKADIPIIICTGYSQRINKNMATQLGIRAFLMKPLLMQELANTVRKVLDKK